jgi:hypothetical protein
MHKIHTQFMEWAAGYDSGDLSMRSRQRHEQWLQTIPCPVVRLEGAGTVDEHLGEVIRQFESQ